MYPTDPVFRASRAGVLGPSRHGRKAKNTCSSAAVESYGRIMTVTVLDTATSMAAVLDAAPAEREDRVRAMLAPAADMFRYFPGEVDLAQLHTMSMGFPLDRELERVKEALERFRAAEVWTRMHTALEDAIALQRSRMSWRSSSSATPPMSTSCTTPWD